MIFIVLRIFIDTKLLKRIIEQMQGYMIHEKGGWNEDEV